MNAFERCLEILQRNNLTEMTTLRSSQHDFGVDVKINIFKYTDRNFKHGSRIKVYKKFENENFTITISDNPKVIGDWKEIVNRKELNILVGCVKLYKNALQNYWYDITTGIEDLLDDIERIDSGENVERRF